MNLKGREDQNGAKPSEVQHLHTWKHEKGRWRVLNFKGSAPMATRWGRPTPRFGRPLWARLGLSFFVWAPKVMG